MLVGWAGEDLCWGHVECYLLAALHNVHARGHGKRSTRGTGKYTLGESTGIQIFLLPVGLFEILLGLQQNHETFTCWHARVLQLARVQHNHKHLHVNVIEKCCSFEHTFLLGILSFANLFTTESCQGHNPLHHLFIPDFTIFLYSILPPPQSAVTVPLVKSC